MGLRRIIGILIVIVGILCLGVSYYINNQILQGVAKIKSAQEKVNKGNDFFSGSSNPVMQGIGSQVTGSAQKKINLGKEEIEKYTAIADNLQMGGIVLLIVGGILIIIPRKRR